MEKQKFNPIFICGNSRSGTTLMAKILKGNTSVFVFRELHYFEKIWNVTDNTKLSIEELKKISAKLVLTIREGLFSTSSWQSYLNSEEVTPLINKQDEQLTGYDVYRTIISNETRKDSKIYSCEQTPRNLFYLTELLNEYENAKALIMIRDPRSIMLSQKEKWKRVSYEQHNKPLPLRERLRTWSNYHPIVTSLLWNAAINAGQRVESNTRVMVIKFEDLVTNPQNIIKEICTFLELDYDDAMLDVAGSKSPTINTKINSIESGINPAVAGQWMKRLRSTDIFWCELICRKNMEYFEYRLTNNHVSWFRIIQDMISLPFKTSLSLLLNLRTMSSIYQSIKRRIRS